VETETVVLIVAAIVAAICILLIWQETRVRQRNRGCYIAPITQYRRELSRAGIGTAIAAILWVWLTPSSVWAAAAAFFPALLCLFILFGPRPD
jgi:ABC-type Fe3+ transport system permease subunit